MEEEIENRGISEKLMNLGGSGGPRASEKRKLKWELRRKKAERETMSRIEEEINENTHKRAKECQRRKERGKREHSDVNRKRRMGGCSSEIDH